MTLSGRVALWRLDRRLRRLQDLYYDAEIYDGEHLSGLLRQIGFDVRRDLRDFGLNLFVEAVKR